MKNFTEISHVFRAETSGGGGGYRGVIHPSNFEKISLVGQNIASHWEKTKQKGCPTLTCNCVKTTIHRFGIHILYIKSNLIN